MFDPFSILFNQQWQNYTLILMIAIILSFAWMLWRFPKAERGQVFDVCLAALIGGLVIGRLMHVALNWIFFSERLDLIWKIHREGGLNWQAVVIGVLIFGYIMAKIRAVPVLKLLEQAIIILPFLAFCGCYACATAACAYGAPIDRMADYPTVMTWFADDIYRLNMPRFATQPLGMMSAATLLLITIFLYWRGWLVKTRFCLILLLLSASSFGISFLRGDYALDYAGLRAGQWLDMGMIVLSILIILWVWSRSSPVNPE